MAKTHSIKTSFPGWNGHVLDAKLELPNDSGNRPASAFAIFCHCFTCSKDTLATFRVSRILAELGFAVLRFDFTGLGNSEGRFSRTNFSTNLEDVAAAIKFLDEKYQVPSLLVGHSLGGTAMLASAMTTESIKAVVTIASPSQPKHVLRHFGSALTELEQGKASSFEVAGQRYEVEPHFIEDARQYDMQALLAKMTKPALIFNIENDTLVGEGNAEQIDNWIAGESKIITLENSDHVLSDRNDARFVAEEISAWYGGLF